MEDFFVFIAILAVFNFYLLLSSYQQKRFVLLSQDINNSILNIRQLT